MIIYAYVVLGWYVLSVFITAIATNVKPVAHASRVIGSWISLAIILPIIGSVLGWW